ncbi:rod-binding protein [Salinarimonas rosea]|uniref:rod-binding protein n=1 Tax=Salinarimonas rosea TaxID=552063 RepID=UPI00041B88F0|nr:rod-binding protein [Salinarimonas rosea]
MTISPPSDIILEVARAADPTALAAATERLRDIAVARGRTGEGFETAVAEAGRPPAPPPVPMPPPSPERLRETLAALAPSATPRLGAGPDLPGAPRVAAGPQTPAQAFEATFLRQVVETLMPRSEAMFGEGTAGSIWRGFLAEEIGAELARAGGVGIAAAVAEAHPQLGQVNAAKAALWPEHAQARLQPAAAAHDGGAPYFSGFYRS